MVAVLLLVDAPMLSFQKHILSVSVLSLSIVEHGVFQLGHFFGADYCCVAGPRSAKRKGLVVISLVLGELNENCQAWNTTPRVMKERGYHIVGNRLGHQRGDRGCTILGSDDDNLRKPCHGQKPRNLD